MSSGHSSAQSPAVIRETLTEKTVQLMGWLKDGTFKPGFKIPSQNEPVQQLGISRTGVREALHLFQRPNGQGGRTG